MDKLTLLQLLQMSKEQIKDYLSQNKEAITGTNSILWLKDTRYPCLVAHIDNVYEHNKAWNNRIIIYDKGYFWSPSGIAGDDRCGIYAILTLYPELNVNAIFTDLEESGGIGAKEVAQKHKELLKEVPYLIEVDRRGHRQAVFYNQEAIYCPEFVDTVVETGFTKEIGTFSDISIIGKALNVASVNVSAGFYHEHRTSAEYIYEPHLQETISLIPKLIHNLGMQKYTLPDIPEPYSYYYYRDYDELLYRDCQVYSNYKNKYKDNYNYYDYSDDIYALKNIYDMLLEDSYDMPIDELYNYYFEYIDIEPKALRRLKKMYSRKDYKRLLKIIDTLRKYI